MRRCGLVLCACVGVLPACASGDSGSYGDLPQDGTGGSGSGTDGDTSGGSDDGDGSGSSGATSDGGSTSGTGPTEDDSTTGDTSGTSGTDTTATDTATSTTTDTGTSADTGTSVAECGNGVIEQGEQCDDPDLDGQDCQTMGLTGGTLACTESCIFDTSACDGNTCGDGTIDGLDECDCGADNCSAAELDNKTCADFPPFDGGTLGCFSPYNCTFDVSGCYYCGDGTVDPTEECDGTNLDGRTCETLGYLGGDLACAASCNLDTSDCTLPAAITECSTPNVSIPDPGSVADTITIPLAGTVTDVNVFVVVEHFYVGDVRIELQHLGTERDLVNQSCGSSNHIDATFDDEGSPLFCAGDPVISGNVLPYESLDVYDGIQAQGDWVLEAFDVAGSYAGLLEHWCVTISF